MALKQPSNRKKQPPHTMGKAQAREQFAPLVETLATNGGVVEITDYGKVSAVILGYTDYMLLLTRANAPFKPTRTLCGSATLIGDIEEATKEVSKVVLDSIQKTVSEL